jgi:hypothetical protein
MYEWHVSCVVLGKDFYLGAHGSFDYDSTLLVVNYKKIAMK